LMTATPSIEHVDANAFYAAVRLSEAPLQASLAESAGYI
jgi:nucleotidyltransferase/DNA polymerase involved in DNA repair